MENQNNRKEALRKRIEDVLKNRKPDLSDLGSKTLEEILQEVSIYHQELEYQNLELQRVYDELEKSQFHYVELFQDAPMGYVVVDEANKILSVNKMFAGYFDSKIEEIKGNLISQYIHPDFQDQFYLLVKKVHKEKTKSSVLVRLYCEKERFAKLECNVQKENGYVFYRMGFLDVTREVINEEQLIESRERYRAVADYAYHWEYWQDQQGRLLYMSPSCERITGYTKYEFFDNPRLMEDIIHPDDKHHFDEHKSVAIIPGETRVEHIAEYRITRKDGEVRWIGHACQSIFKEDGTHIGQRATNRDITERKKIRENLTENLNLLSNTQELAHIGSWELDVETSKLIWSDEIYRIFGIDPQQFEGSYEKFLETVHPDDREAVNEAYVNSLRDDANTYEIEHRIVRRDNNEVRYVYEKCYHERDNSGRVIRSVGMVQDITERKQREQKLVISDRIFKHALDMLCIAGFDGYFKTLNPSWEKILGWSTEELMAKPWIEFVHMDDREATKDIRTVLVDGQEIYQFENRYVCKDGSYKWLSWNSYPYPKENIMFGVARDVTYKKQAEERLRNSELQLKDQNEELTLLNEELQQSNEQLRNVMDELKESNQRINAILSALPDLMFVVNRDGVYVDYYSPNDSLLVAKPSAFLGKSAYHILPKDIAEMNMRALEQLFETGEYQSFSYSLEENNETKYFDARLVLFGSDRALAIVRDITEQKKGQLTIAKNEKYLKTILQTTADGFWITDLQGNLLEVNEAYCKMSGYSLHELINLKIEQIDVNENPQQVEEHIGRVLELGSDIFETKHRRKDGTIFDVEVSVTYLDANGGQLVCFTRDITERKHAEQELKESNENISFLADKALSFVKISSFKEFYNFVGESVHQLYPDAYLMVNSVYLKESCLITEKVYGDKGVVNKAISLLGYKLEGKRHSINKSFLKTADGKLMKVEGGLYEFALGNVPKGLVPTIEKLLNINSIYGIAIIANEEIVSSIGIIFPKGSDIHKIETLEAFVKQASIAYNRIIAEESLRVSEDRFKLSMEATKDGLWDWNVKTKEAYYSPAYYTMLGYEVGGFSTTGSVWKRLVHPDDWDRVNGVINSCVNGISENFSMEFRMKSNSGEWKWIYSRARAVERDKNGKALRMVGTHVDITERKNAENEILKRELLLNKIFDVIPIGLWFTDEKGTLQRGNPAGVKIWGAEPTVPYEEYGVFKARRLPSGEEIAPDDWALAHTIKDGKTITDELIEIDAFDGKTRTILNYTAPVLDNEGKMLGAIVVNNDITELHKAQENLRTSQQLLQTISDNMFDLVALSDLEGNYTFAGASHKILGYEIDEIIGTTVMAYVHPEDLPMVQEAFGEFIANQEDNKRVEYRNRCADGTYLWFETVGRFILDENGKPNQILFNSRDITQRIQADQALRESETRFKALHNASFGGITIHDKGLILDCNQGLSEITGYCQEELIGMNGLLLIAEETRDMVLDNILAGYEKPYEALGIRKDGSKYPLRLEARNIPYKGKQVRVVEFRDITEQKLAEEKLAHSHYLMRYIIEHSSSAIAVHDRDMNYIYVSQRYLKEYNVKDSNIIGKNHYEIFPDLPQKWRDVHQKALAGEISSAEDDPYYKDDGTVEWTRWECRPWYDVDGSIGGIIVYTEVITERKQAELALKKSQEILSETQKLTKVGGWEWDVEKQTMTWTDEVYRIHGLRREEISDHGEGTIAKSIECYAPEFRSLVQESFGRCVEHGEPYDIEVPFTNLQGEKLWVRTTAKANYVNGKIASVIGNIMDITERKNAEITVKQSEEKYRMLFEANRDGIAIFRFQPDGGATTFIEANPSAAKMLGYTYEEFLQITVNDLEVEVGKSIMERRMRDLKSTGLAEFETTLRHKNGHFIYANVKAIVINYLGGPAVLNITRDITDRKQVELAIKAKTAELEAIYNNSPLMMCILDEHQNVVYANNYLVEFFGKPYDEIINGRACGVFGCINASEHKLGCGYSSKCPSCDLNNAIAQTIKTGQSLRDVEYNAVVDFLGENKDISLMAYTSLIKTQKKLVSLIFVDVSERKQMEDALREREEMMRSSQSVAQICSYSTNLNEDEIGKSAWVCSPEFYNIFGIDDTYPHTIEGWANFIHPDCREEVFAYHESVVKEKKSFNREYKIIRINDGAERWVLGTGELVYDKSGKPIRMYGAIQDITERKHAENALRESEERFRGLYENATVGIYRTTPDGQILLANPALVRMLEYSSFEELTRRNLNNKDYETGFERTEFMRLIEERGEVKGLQSGWRTKSGKIINISESARAVYDNKGKVLYYEGIVEDITERKKAVDALRASQERISSIFRVAPIGIGVVVNRVLTEVNQTICDITGYAKDELLGQSAQILYPTKEEFEYVGKEKYRQITEKGTGTVETIWQRKDGSLINVLLSSTPIVQGDLSQGVTFTALDITQRKQNERLRDGRLRLLEFADTHSLPELLKETLAVAEDLTGSQIGFYHFIDEEKGVIKLNQWSERTEKEFCKVTGKFDMHYPIDKAGVWVECVKKRKPIIHNDYQALAHRKELPKGHALVSRELTVPVIRNKRIVAVLGIGNKATNYCKNDIDIITQLADMAWDIAERKMAEEQVLKLSKGIEQSPATVVITDIDGNIEFVNPMFTEVTGYTAQEAMGQNPRVLKSDFHTQEFYRELWDTIKGGNDWRGELCNRKKGGEIYWESASISPIKNENGEIVNFIAVKEDITDRKNAILALEQNNRLINTMLDNLPIGIFMVDAINGKPIIANEHAKKLLGRGIVDDASTETLSEVYMAYKAGSANLYPTEEMPIVRGMNGQASYVDDMEVLQPDGNRVFLEVYGCPVYNSNGEVWASLVGFTDITERKKAEVALRESELTLKEKNEEYLALNEELTESNQRIIAINHDLVVARQKAEESDKLKSAFLANMSHEIRTPMNAIIGFSEMLLNPNLPNERKDFFAQILNTACHQLLNVVEDVIDISKIETGQMEVHQSEVQINQTLSRIKEIFLPQANSNGVQITTTKFFPDGEDRVITDANKLNQVLTNLVSNAVKFTDSGTIQIAYSVRNKMLEFSVSDTGVGIDREHHELIFERFRQVEMGSTRQYGGTGLGLPISKSFVEMLGGTIWLESEPGKGSAFFFTIPYYPTQMEETSRLNNDVEFNFTGKTILIAEDEEANFLYINELIEETGATIIRATNGQEAIDIFFSDVEVNVILMDIKMPMVGGIEATEAIRQRNNEIPIIALTAYAMSSDREKCLSAGCNKYLSKPVRRNELLRAIADIIM